MSQWWQAHKPTTRRLFQLYCALLYNANVRGFVKGQIYPGPTKNVCVPGFNCYSCPGAIGACPLGAFQNAVASSGARAGTYVLGILMLYGVILGRTICGWLCPLGMIQELLHKIPTPKIKKNRVTRVLSYFKYVLLAILAIAIPLWYGLKYSFPLPAFCKYICPAGTLEGAIGLLSNPGNANYFSMLNILFTRKFVIMLIIGSCSIFMYRSFCRFVCPLGAIYGLFNKVAVIGVKVEASKCTHCGNCVRHCQMDVRNVGDHECISCGRCIDVCASGAIALKAGKYTLKQKTSAQNQNNAEQSTHRRNAAIAWCLALCLLAGMLVYANIILPKKAEAAKANKQVANVAGSEMNSDNSANQSAAGTGGQTNKEATVNQAGTEVNNDQGISEEHAGQDASTEYPDAAADANTKGKVDSDTGEATDNSSEYISDAPLGNQVGEQLPDFTVETIDGSTFHLYETRGSVTVLNLWATWCTPCVQEIPHFCKLQDEHPEINILAVHSSIVTDDVEAYLAAQGWDIQFALDTDDDLIYGIVGGSELLPQTIVLNERGEVVYNMVGSVTYEKLEALLEEASN